MPDPKKIEKAIRSARDEESFIQDVLIDALGWEIDPHVKSVEDMAYEWDESDLRAQELAKHIAGGKVLQIQPVPGNPFGIFLLKFKKPELFTAERGMTTALRAVLRGLVPSRTKKSSLPSFKREHLLFICTHDFSQFRFAYFKSPKDGTKTAPLAAFTWAEDLPSRTVCEYNLSALEWPHPKPTAEEWVAAWSQAFDVEKVTKRFYEDYAEVFAKVEKLIGKRKELAGDELRLFTQTLFNRLMFLRFIERKGWLQYGEGRDYLRSVHQAGPLKGKSFYQSRLKPLFFEGLAVEGKQQSDAIGTVPFLNGGLFEADERDKKVGDIPDECFEPILGKEGLFYRFNFTVEESTPLNIEVAVDPEMLGKVFEELVTGRHESGSYYTPRPVVSFMCREALKGVLADKTDAKPEAIAALVDKHEVKGLRESQARQILQTLDNLKAVDPACGSGAYLLGLLHEMVDLYHCLQSSDLVKDSRSLYDLKLRIISQNLYGVDIDPFATNIAMLRLWLSLTVDADAPVPLPNLDFKIESGDSLLAPDPQDTSLIFRNQLTQDANALVNCKEQYLLATGTEKTRIRETIKSNEKRLRGLLDTNIGAGVIDWRIQFAEAFTLGRGGFDIVLANPPYVRKENILADTKESLLQNYSEAVTGQSDLFCFFYTRGLQLLRRGGMHVFVCSNSWLDSGYGVKLQSYLLKNSHVQAIYDSAVEKQFATAEVNTIISVVQKGPSSPTSLTNFVSLRAAFDLAIGDKAFRRELLVPRAELWNGGIVNGSTRTSVSYVGNKWGGRYLRAPDIYGELRKRAGNKLVRLSEVAEVDGYIHDNNTGKVFPKKPFLKSIKNAQSIAIDTSSTGVELFGVKQTGNSSRIAPILFPRTFGVRHLIIWNRGGVYGKEFYKVLPHVACNIPSIVGQLNSTFGLLQREVLGLANLGEGAIKFSADDVSMFEVIPNLLASLIERPLERMAKRRMLDVPEELEEADRKELDAVIFDALGLSESERRAVYGAVQELIARRVTKANSR